MSIRNTGAFLLRKIWFKIPVALMITFILVMSVSKLHPINETEENAPLETFTSHLEERILAIMKDYGIPGVSIALVKGSRTVWTEAYGYADLGTGRRMTADTCLRVQSISKPVTAWGVMHLVEQRKIELDKPVAQYIKNWEFPESEFSEGKITVGQLLSHTSGMAQGDLTRYSPKEDMPSLEESLSEKAILVQEPGLLFSYSNTGYNLLELLIEEVTGRDFAEYMKQEVLLPLGMADSTFIWSEELEPAVPFGYGQSGKPVPVYVYPEKASGGLFSTAEDIASFMIAGMPEHSENQSVLNSQSISKLYTPMAEDLGIYSLVFNAYGLGYYIEDLHGGRKAVSHGGQGTGWMTHFHYVPETGDGIVILTNSQRSWPFIAYILSDWARWNGFESVGMGRIILAQRILWALIGLIWVGVLWQALRLLDGLVHKKRAYVPLSKKFRPMRLAQGILFVLLVAGLLWCMEQKFLFVTSIFPIASRWMGITAFASAVILLLSALFPPNGKRGFTAAF